MSDNSPTDNPPKKVDPGWNDPPMLNYTPSNPPPKSRITNKRVAFPIGSTSGTPVASPSSKPPPASGPSSDENSDKNAEK